MTGSGSMVILRFHHKFTARATEWLFAVFLTGWGVILLSFPHIFTAVETSKQFAVLARTFPQPVWGFGCLIMGVSRLIALYINGARKSTPYVRMAMAFLSCFFWYQITLGFILSGVPATGFAMYPPILLFEMYNVFRASGDARGVFDQVRAKRDDDTGDSFANT